MKDYYIRMRSMIVMASVALVATAVAVAQTAPAQSSWQLVWSDEFNGPAGSQPNPTYWTYDLGLGSVCCGNQELETYTNLAENAHMDGLGHLDIHIENPSPGVYTSARIKTEGLYSVAYGRIEARIKVPAGQGMWPAFWMLGDNITTVNWPACGEIDIMENVGFTPGTAYGSLHGPSGYNVTAQYQLPDGQKLSDGFHVYAIEWSHQQIAFYVDGNLYETQTGPGDGWVFDVPNNPFFIILNAAVGGDWPGGPDATTQFPQDMLIDYVRVYQAQSVAGPVINAGGVVAATESSTALAPGSLASIYGTGLATGTNGATFDAAAGAFPQSASGVQVLVNGAAAPLIYLSPQQINFAVPWDSLVGTPLNVEVMLNNVLSNAVPITLTSTAPSLFGQLSAAPGPFYSDYLPYISCPSVAPFQPNEYCTVWGNGFGPTNPPLGDGTLAPGSPPPLLWTVNTCAVTIGGAQAQVTYCGAAPGEIIYQLNFVYPAGVVSGGGKADSTITVNGNTWNFILITGPAI